MKNEGTGKLSGEHRQTFIGHGARLEIIATEIEKGKWTLSVVNGLGIASNWCEFFESMDRAVEAALDAIREEGVKPFLDTEGYEYLLDDYNDWR